MRVIMNLKIRIVEHVLVGFWSCPILFNIIVTIKIGRQTLTPIIHNVKRVQMSLQLSLLLHKCQVSLDHII